MGFFFLGITHQWCSALWWLGFTTNIPFAELLPHSNPFRMFPHSQLQSSALVCSPNSTFQHPALVCIAGHASKAGWAGLRSVPCVQVSSVLLPHPGLPCFLPTEVRLSFCAS